MMFEVNFKNRKGLGFGVDVAAETVVEARTIGAAEIARLFPDESMKLVGCRSRTAKLDDLKAPSRLIRKPGRRLTNEEARSLVSPRQRQWAPIRQASQIPARPSLASITTAMALSNIDPALPVKVQLKSAGKQGSTLLTEYPNLAAFNAAHDAKTYPLKGEPVTFEGHVVVLVTAKPWAGKSPSTKAASPSSRAMVLVNGNEYRSVLAAFQALHLPVPKHQKFRAELKKKGALTFTHDGKEFNFQTR